MSHEPCDSDDALPLRVTREIDAVCDEFEAALKQGSGLVLEPYVGRVEAVGRERLIEELALVALARLQEKGIADPLADLLAANPALRSSLARISPPRVEASTIHHDGRLADGGTSGLAVRCPHCHSMIAMVVDASLVEIVCTNCGGNFSLVNDGEKTRDAPTLTKIAHFDLISRLGMGEFGTVWKARDTILDRTVALKIPRREQMDADSSEKFMREARAAAQLRHPNIVSTHEVGRDGDKLYIVSDYVRGVSLAEVLADHRVGVRESATIAAKIADALEHAHRSGVVHRDLKPSNILMDDRDEPHLMDFGLAKRKEPGIMVTTEGVILGTPAYMSPEQARGEASRVDGRSDVYSLGVILYQLLTGALPFRGSTRMLLQKVINDDPPGLRTLESRVPKDLENVCLKCLEKDPARRYGSAADLATDLRRYLAGEPVLARSIGRVARLVRWARRNRAVAALLGATLAILLAATAVSSYFAWRAARSAREVTDKFYDSLLSEMRLTREVRGQGYGERVRQLVGQAQKLGSENIDRSELRRQLVLSMGDFVAEPPHAMEPFKDDVMAFCLNRDGGTIIVGFNSGKLLVCDADDHARRTELGRFASAVSSIAISKDERTLVAADDAGNVKTWTRGKEGWKEQTGFLLDERARLTAFSEHGTMLAASRKAALDLWDVARATKLRTLPVDANFRIQNIALDLPRERVIAAYVDLQTDRVGWLSWNSTTGAPSDGQSMPSLGNTYVNGIAVDDAGDRLAIGFDEALLVYDLPELEPVRLSGFDSTKAVAFSPAGPYLAATNIRGQINVWNSATRRLIGVLKITGAGMGRNLLAFSADGGRLVASQSDSIRIWNLKEADEKLILAGHKGGIPAMAFQPGGRLLATGGKDDAIRFWDPQTGAVLGGLDIGEAVQTLAFSPDGRLLAVGCMGQEEKPHFRLIDVGTRKVVYEASPKMGDVFSLAWAADAGGSYLAGCGDHGVALWKISDGATPSVETVLEEPRDFCLAIVIDPHAGRMAWVERERKLAAWDVRAARELPLHAPDLKQGWNGLALLPDGECVTYVSKSGVAEVWNVPKDERVAALGRQDSFVSPYVGLSPDGRWFAAVPDPGVVSIWDRPADEHAFSLRPEAGTVWALVWDPASERLAVSQSDGGLVIWSLAKIQDKLDAAGLLWRGAK